MNKIYYKEIDVLKGIGIILVVLGHLKLPNEMTKFIFSFHMPLFFFVSGFVFKPKNSFDFIRDKFKRILVPYFVFSAITFLLYYIPNYSNSELNVIDFVIGTLLGVSDDYYLSWNVVLWFLPSLFFINVLFNFLYNYKNTYFIIVALFIISLSFLKDNTTLFLPFHIGSALIMIPFFILGYLLKQQYPKFISILKNKEIILILLSLLIFLIGTIFSYNNDKLPDVRIHIIGDVFLFYTGALLTILGLLGLARVLQSRVLIWLGMNSLIIMCVHLKLRSVVTAMSNYLPFEDYLGILQTILIIVLCIPFVYIINRWFPILIGLKK